MSVFPYYSSLTRRQKATYDASDKVQKIRLPDPASIRPDVIKIKTALDKEDRARIKLFTKKVTDRIVTDLDVPRIRIKILAVRPSNTWGELHGLYEPTEGRKRAVISIWIRTAHHKKIVAFRTFLRTLLHEICHHLDYELLKLADSYHTEGFFKRESSLFKQLIND